jgi:hypothetical protein
MADYNDLMAPGSDGSQKKWVCLSCDPTPLVALQRRDKLRFEEAAATKTNAEKVQKATREKAAREKATREKASKEKAKKPTASQTTEVAAAKGKRCKKPTQTFVQAAASSPSKQERRNIAAAKKASVLMSNHGRDGEQEKEDRQREAGTLPKLRLGKSKTPNAGTGVIAEHTIKKNDLIGKYFGKKRTAAEFETKKRKYKRTKTKSMSDAEIEQICGEYVMDDGTGSGGVIDPTCDDFKIMSSLKDRVSMIYVRSFLKSCWFSRLSW